MCLLKFSSDLIGQPTLQNHIDGLVQICSNSSALSMLLQSCTKPTMYDIWKNYDIIIRNNYRQYDIALLNVKRYIHWNVTLLDLQDICSTDIYSFIFISNFLFIFKATLLMA